MYIDVAEAKDKVEVCLANKTWLGDGLCEDEWNKALCLFDGGDCCLETKIKSLCDDCFCTLDIDPYNLSSIFAADEVKTFKAKPLFDSLLKAVSKTFENVISVDVCSWLCSDPTIEEHMVNSWIYDIDRQDCKCTLIETVPCIDQTYLASSQRVANDFDMYLQLRKTLPCGEFESL